MGVTAGVASLASAGLGAYGSIASAAGTKSADEMQAARLEQAAAYGKVQATQVAAQDTEKLSIKLDNIDAVRAAQNNDPTSPTTAAIKSRTSYLANRDQQIQVGNIMEQSATDTAGAAYMNQAGSYAMTMGEVGAGANLLKGIGATNWGSFGFGGTPA
jgi:hypothetical protein